MFLCSLLLLCVNVLFFFHIIFYFTKPKLLLCNLTHDHTYIILILFFYSVQTVVITQNCSDKSITGKVRDLYLHEYLHFFQNSLCHKIKLQ